ncbi:hypothetical protein AHIS1_p078 [Acaryochloris phage A-HIS1]|nr:hypothetical protein AHIS1_p078 [Acaryochloris phage A-HIS1]
MIKFSILVLVLLSLLGNGEIPKDTRPSNGLLPPAIQMAIDSFN